jgi:hypothetical protein
MILEELRDRARLNPSPPHSEQVRSFNITLNRIAGYLKRGDRLSLISQMYGVDVVSTKYLTAGQINAFYAILNGVNAHELEAEIESLASDIRS